MPNWTEEQKKVVDLRNGNILVSAAAGSGKTAVLVERIVNIISDEKNKIDIDHLLIVTFTNAAAAEMRERIGQAIETKLVVFPSDSHLQKQQTLIHNAQITTIHSFCLNVIRNNFNIIELDPSFRIGDETELKLLKSDIVSELLEKHYEQKNETFYDFIESYSVGKTDVDIENLILQLYTFSQSYPEPEDWLNSLRKSFDINTVDDLEQTEWMKFLLDYIKEVTTEVEVILDKALAMCQEEDGAYMYLPTLMSDKVLIKNLNSVNSYETYSKILCNLIWTPLSPKKDKNVSLEKRETAKNLRAEIKTNIDSIRKNYFFQLTDGMIEDIIGSKSVMNVLIDLTIEFSKAYVETKTTKNILDFNDLEHKALSILVTKNSDASYSPTPTAYDLSKYYEEIVIDEYQDSNLVQETILNSISREKFGQPNIFMVGDVKQSIYKFRLAKPEIFIEKYNTYLKNIDLYYLVDLHKNFRSRENVIDCINFIFEQIMDTKLGGISYSDKVALYSGAEFPPIDNNYNTELMIVDLSVDVLDESDKEEFDYTSKEFEAKAVADKIKSIISGNFQIYDKDVKSYRNIKYKDIVILLRTVIGWADIFENVLMREGIAAHCNTSTGYFSTIEIQTVLSILNIIDNPRQDIALVAVLKSPIVQLTSEELAIIKSEFLDKNMYDCVMNYIKCGSKKEIQNKLANFICRLDKFRDCVPYTNIHQLIEYILDETDYYNYVSAMPAGEKRKANIDMLIERAIQFEATSYKGLFNFIRYIDKMRDYQIDFGEASILGDNENVVRIMSIHKSKGLEFPVVFVSGLSKEFNNQDARAKIVMHSDLGIGPNYIDYKSRVKSPTLIKKIISKKIMLENLGEELRILYVALTRAKEKLILTGTAKNWNKILNKHCEMLKQYSDTKLPFNLLSSSNTYLDWIIPALLRHNSFNKILNEKNIYMNKTCTKYDKANFEIKIIDLSQLLKKELNSQINKEILKENLLNWKTEIFDNDLHKEIERRLNWSYKHMNEANLNAKMTVTELKVIGQDLDNQYSQNLISTQDSNIPKFISQIVEIKGSTRGTVVHKVMQNINFSAIKTLADVDKQLKFLIKINKLTTQEKNLISNKEIYNFIKSPLAERMVNAEACSKIFKEKQFIVGIKACDINIDFKSDELVLVQGIIDVYFEEDNGIVLVDYKTDSVVNEISLIERYKTQLDYYQKAVEQITTKQVIQKIIYSFSMSKEILL